MKLDFVENLRWLPITNVGASPIPSFGLVEVTGALADGTLQVRRPTANGRLCLVNGLTTIPVGGYGLATNETPCWALYDAGDGTPANGETWGAGSGSYLLRKDNAGFLIDGGAADSRVFVRRDSGGGGGGGDGDELVKVSSNDTTAGYLNGKLVAGTNVTITENNDGSNETLTISAATFGGITVEAEDGTPSYTSIDTLQVYEPSGLTVSQPGAGVALIDIQGATETQAGIVTTGTQAWTGNKTLSAYDSGGTATVFFKVSDYYQGNYVKLDASASGDTQVVVAFNYGTLLSPDYEYLTLNRANLLYTNDTFIAGGLTSQAWDLGIISELNFGGGFGLGLVSRFGGSGGAVGSAFVTAGGLFIVQSTIGDAAVCVLDAAGNRKGGFWGTLSDGTVVCGGLIDTAGSGGLSDGDKGDITVSGSGSTFTIDNDAVTNAKLDNAPAWTLKGNPTSGSANPQDFTITSLAAETTPTSGDLLLIEVGGELKKLDIDDLPTGSSGITSLNGETGSSQSFADNDDTNVTLTISSSSDTHTFTLGWSGQLAASRGGTGLDGSSAANGELLIGNGSGFSLATLTAGSGIVITTGAGSISIAASGGSGLTQAQVLKLISFRG